MDRRRLVLALFALPLGAGATPAARAKKRLGVAYLPGRDVIESVQHDWSAYHAFGWYEGRTLDKVKRYADFDESRFDLLARELVAERVDVLLASGVPCTRAMQKATRTIPICAIVDDPVGNGFAKTLRRPGGNITGLCEGYAETSMKEIELLRAAMPGLSRIAVTSTSHDVVFLRDNSRWLVEAATRAGIAIDFHAPRSPAQMAAVVEQLPAGRSAIYVRRVSDRDAAALARLGAARRVAVVGQEEELVDHGVLMTFRPLIAEDHVLVAMLDRLLRGANPAEIPFELPTRSVLAINRKAAAAIGIRFPADFALRAQKVVD